MGLAPMPRTLLLASVVPADNVSNTLERLAVSLPTHPARRRWQRRRVLHGMHPRRHAAADAGDRWAGGNGEGGSGNGAAAEWWWGRWWCNQSATRAQTSKARQAPRDNTHPFALHPMLPNPGMLDQYNQALIQASYGSLSLSADVAVLPEIYLPYDANVEDNFTYYEAPAVEVRRCRTWHIAWAVGWFAEAGGAATGHERG